MNDRPLDLSLLQVFFAVCASRQLNAAALQLGITPSAVSQCIRKLEASLGTELLLRDTRPVQLTAAGRRLEKEGRPVLLAAQALRRDFQSLGNEPVMLRIGYSETVTGTISPWVTKAIRNKVADLEIHCSLNKTLSRKLHANELDVCIYSEALLDEPQWHRVPVYEELYLGVTPRGVSVRTTEELKSLAAERPFVCYTTDSHDRQMTDRYLKAIGIEPRVRVQTASTYCLAGLIGEIGGWSILPPTNILSAASFAGTVSAWRLPSSPTPAPHRRTWVVGKPEFAPLVRWIAGETLSIFRRWTVPSLRGIDPALASSARELLAPGSLPPS